MLIICHMARPVGVSVSIATLSDWFSVLTAVLPGRLDVCLPIPLIHELTFRSSLTRYRLLIHLAV